MGKYDAVSYRLISHIDEAFPVRCLDSARDWEGIDRVLSNIPLEGERAMTVKEICSLYR